jgi:hypothetical protein
MSEQFHGFQQPSSGSSEHNATDFIVRMILGQLATATVVRVEAVDTAAGTVDVLPLVKQVNGIGDAYDHGVIYGLPYVRIQGGVNAIILDPAAGDLGLAVFANRDISAVKANRAPSPPGSARVMDWADGVYVGGILNAAPTQYVELTTAGVRVLSPTKITLEAPVIECLGALTGSSTGTFTGDVVAAGKSVSTHTHGGVTIGSGTTGTPT